MMIFSLIVFLSLGNQLSVNPEVFQHTKNIDSDTVRIIEKVYLHCDRSKYFAGEDIWFKAYLADASDLSLTDNSNNLHVDLISPESKIISSLIVRIDNGLGNGDLRLLKDLKSGIYSIRAYTNYMRNYSNALFFTKNIEIVNPTDKDEAANYVTGNIDKDIYLEFFPEGGSLVDNISSKVAFKATDSHGKSREVRGKVYSSDGRQITTFSTKHLGMGTFILRPSPGARYFSEIITRNGDTIRNDIPVSFETGLTLSVKSDSSGGLLITTKTNNTTLPKFLNHDLELVFSQHNSILKRVRFQIKSLINSLSLTSDDLPEGIVKISLADPDKEAYAERLFFITKNRNPNFGIVSDKLTYKRREHVTLDISLKDDSLRDYSGYFSCSVTAKKFSESKNLKNSTICSWFLLESEVKGEVEDPSYYFDPSNLSRYEDLDLLLQSQGWRDFSWKYESPEYIAEKGFTVTGSVKHIFFNKPVAYSRINVGLFKRNEFIPVVVPTDSSGRFSLEGIDFTGNAQLVINSFGTNRVPGILQIDSIKYNPLIPTVKAVSPESRLPEEDSTILREYQVYQYAKGRYKLTDTLNLGEVTITGKKTTETQTIKIENVRTLYGAPDNEIIVTPLLLSYSNAIDIMVGRIAGVEIRKTPYGYIINIRGRHTINGNTQPLFLIDGIKSDLESVTSMPVSFIDRIDVLKSAGATAMFGSQGTNGIISIITKTSDKITSYTARDKSNIKISGYDTSRIFYSPRHVPGNEMEYLPDFRTTLLWVPNIVLTSSRNLHLEYFNSDIASTVQVLVEGITVSGIPLSKTIEYVVGK